MSRKRAQVVAEIRARTALMAIAGKRHRRRPVPRQAQPDTIRLSYFAALRHMIEDASSQVLRAVRPRFAEMVSDFGPTKHDAADVAERVDEGEHSGTYLGLSVPPDAGELMAVPGGEPADGLHITLFYAKGLTAEEAALALERFREVWEEYRPIEVVVRRLGVFLGSSSSDWRDVLYARPESAELLELRRAFMAQLAKDGVAPSSEHAFTPHITLKYLEPGELRPGSIAPVRFEMSDYVFEAGDPAASVRTDAIDFNAFFDAIAGDFFSAWTNSRFAELARSIANRTATFQQDQLVRQWKAMFGLDVLKMEPWLASKVEAFTAESVSLIKSIPAKFFTQVESQVIRAAREGLRWEELAEIIEARTGVAEASAKLVARDQVGKFMGELNAARQQELGVSRFIWRTARDNRVRESHEELEGKIFAWNDPPIVDGQPSLPGEPINCRCQAEPLLADVIAELTEPPANQPMGRSETEDSAGWWRVDAGWEGVPRAKDGTWASGGGASSAPKTPAALPKGMNAAHKVQHSKLVKAGRHEEAKAYRAKFEKAPAPQPVAKVTTSHEAAAAAAPGSLAALSHAAVPKPSELTFEKSGKEMGGAGEKDVYKDATGQEWLFKAATVKGTQEPKPYAVDAQVAFSEVAGEVKDHVPVAAATMKGKLGTLQPILSLASPTDLAHVEPSKLSSREKLDVAQEHVLDWVMSQHDTHGGNLLRTSDGRVVGVDKEQGFRFFGKDKLSVSYAPNSDLYGEKPPYYNRFWEGVRDGSVKFDPHALGPTIAKVEAIPSERFAAIMRPYAESAGKGEAFVAAAVARKESVRGDFERFIGDLQGKPFSFAHEDAAVAGWIGVDLDGTLSERLPGDHEPLTIGPPVPAMVARVKRWLADGREVRVFTARAADPAPGELEAIAMWCRRNLGVELAITNEKDPGMVELWDDRAVGVEPDTGEPVARGDGGHEDAGWEEVPRAKDGKWASSGEREPLHEEQNPLPKLTAGVKSGLTKKENKAAAAMAIAGEKAKQEPPSDLQAAPFEPLKPEETGELRTPHEPPQVHLLHEQTSTQQAPSGATKPALNPETGKPWVLSETWTKEGKGAPAKTPVHEPEKEPAHEPPPKPAPSPGKLSALAPEKPAAMNAANKAHHTKLVNQGQHEKAAAYLAKFTGGQPAHAHAFHVEKVGVNRAQMHSHLGGESINATDQEIKAKGAAEFNAWMGSMPAAGNAAMDNYKANGYKPTNGTLRTGTVTEKLAYEIRALTDALANAPVTPRELVVWRGIRLPELAQDPVGYLAGKKGIIHDAGFTSHSLDLQTAIDFAGDDPKTGVVMRIVMPGGTRMRYWTSEHELLTQRDTEHAITPKVYKTKDGFTVLDGKYLGSNPVGLSQRGAKADAMDVPGVGDARFGWTEADFKSGGVWIE